jgi:hypothetical protein
MERAEVLLEKLRQQFQEKAGRDQLLVTLHLLQAEVMGIQHHLTDPGNPKKISVIMPGPNKLSEIKWAEPEIHQSNEKIVELLQVDEKEIEAELASLKQDADLKNESGMKGRPIPESFSDPLDEIPTLASHNAYLPQDPGSVNMTEAVELNERAVAEESSLNDKHRAVVTELADRLQDSPVKDLKKAIGINDRYLYINELFNGNEAMFERTLKTLNSFSILPEAEFWIQRELKLKSGWKEDNPLVQQFIQLVKRRFS